MTQARAERWQEEVLLLREEIHQAIVDIEWRAWQWTNRVNAQSNVCKDLLQGLTAYAYKQADVQRELAADYAKK